MSDRGKYQGLLLEKITEVMLDQLRTHQAALKELQLHKKTEMTRLEFPSVYILNLCMEKSVLHLILWYILPTSETTEIFTGVCSCLAGLICSTRWWSGMDTRASCRRRPVCLLCIPQTGHCSALSCRIRVHFPNSRTLCSRSHERTTLGKKTCYQW